MLFVIRASSQKRACFQGPRRQLHKMENFQNKSISSLTWSSFSMSDILYLALTVSTLLPLHYSPGKTNYNPTSCVGCLTSKQTDVYVQFVWFIPLSQHSVWCVLVLEVEVLGCDNISRVVSRLSQKYSMCIKKKWDSEDFLLFCHCTNCTAVKPELHTSLIPFGTSWQ